MTSYDIIIIGGGPTGLACGIEAQKAGLSYVILEKGAITDAIRRFPINMTFFSTPELLELDHIPFTTVNTRPSRVEALQYYRQVVKYRSLNIRLYARVATVQKVDDGFVVGLSSGEQCRARSVIIATGYFDHTNMLGIPGENLPHVSHYYDEPYRYAHTRVAVIGGRNSAVEAALDLYRHGAAVTLIHRKDSLGDSIKYWVRPDIENRIKNGEIAVQLSTVVEEITPSELVLHNTAGDTRTTIAADFVLAMIGHRPDEALLRSAGVELDPRTLVPSYNPDTFETNVEGLYVAGSVACGCETWNIFIENGRAHAQPVIRHFLAARGNKP
jgi:thioredoxin reductase (NADPH)